MSDKLSPDAHAKILRAVRGAFAEGNVDRLEVRHLRADGEEARASTLTGDRISGKGVTPEHIAEEILQEIIEDSKMFSGVQSYAVLFFRPGEREYSRRVAVQFRGKADKLAQNIEASEPANEKGVAAMLMRGFETMMVRMNQLHETTLRHFAGENDRLSRENMSLRESHLQVLRVGEELIDRKEERRIHLGREAKKDAFIEKGVQQIMMLAGPLMSKVLPGPIGQSVSSDMMTIQLLASLSQEQIQQLISVLGPDQRAAFVELYGTLRQRYEAVKIEGQKQDESANGSQSAATEMKEGDGS